MKSNQTSIPFSQFRSRIKETLLHLEGVSACIDVSAQVLQYQKGTRMSIGEALAVGKVRKEKLKMSVQGQHTLVNSLRKRNYEYVFHVIYTYFSEYLRRILRAMYDHHPMMVAGKAPGKLDFHEIPKLGTFEAISDYIVEQVFRRLEATKSTTQLLERILDHTGTVIPEETLRIALMHIEIRHLIVHNSGIIDAPFARVYGDVNSCFVEGRKLPLSIGLAQSATGALLSLVESIDIQLVASGLVSSAHEQRLRAGDRTDRIDDSTAT